MYSLLVLISFQKTEQCSITVDELIYDDCQFEPATDM